MNDSIKEKSQKIQEALKDFAVCVGPKITDKKVSGLEVEPGIGLESETRVFETLANDISQGIFKVLFMGEFNNGKSTVINAIIGTKAVPVKATACTGVITILLYGKDQNTITVHYTDNTRAPEVFSVDAFFEKYQITYQDEDELQTYGCIKRFAEVQYAIVACEHPLVENGVRIIDSPGISESIQADNTTKNFVPSANAVIFLLNATKPFSKEERDYITIHFSGKQLENVFFVVNRINQIEKEDLETVKVTIEHILKAVFTDDQGNFNQSLFDRRVFYVDAYHAFTAKRDSRNVPPETGMPAFERELENFLSSEEKLIAIFQSTLSAMANTYKYAVHTVESNKKARALPLSKLEQNYQESVQKLDALESSIHSIEQLFTTTSTVVQVKIVADLLQYVSVDLPARWEAEVVNNPDVEFGIGSVLKMALTNVQFWKSQGEKEAKIATICKPVTDFVEKYLKEQLDVWGTRVETIISNDIEDLQNNLNEQIKNFANALSQIKNSLTETVVLPGSSNSIDSVQVLVSTLLGDPSLMIEGIAGSKKGWGEFIRKTIVNLVLDALILLLIPGGPIVFILKELWDLLIGSNETREKMLSSMGATVFPKLQETVRKNSDAMKAGINRFFDDESRRLTSKERQVISDERKRQQALLQQKRNTEFNIENENKREEENLSKMFDLFNTVYTQLYNRPVSMKDIDHIASKR
jgi:predicted GTPase